jgi:hypothetical protein
MRNCQHCKRDHSDPYVTYCKSCYYGVKKHGISFKPKVFKKELIGTECQKCKKIRQSVEDIDGDFCRYCYVIDLKEKNIIWKEKHKKMCRDYQRKKRGIDTELPLLCAPAGSGSIKKGQGYRTICKKEFRGMPHADKKGRIAEHTYIMMQHLGRSLKKGENVHHINGIRDDNRIENLELWHRSQPPGQRLDQKIECCKNFLREYGYNIPEDVE